MAFDGLHYLLVTPFRYPPLPHGSRFGTRAGVELARRSLVRPRGAAESVYRFPRETFEIESTLPTPAL